MARYASRAALMTVGSLSYTSPLRRQLRGHQNVHQRGASVITRQIVRHSKPRCRASRSRVPYDTNISGIASHAAADTPKNGFSRSEELIASSTPATVNRKK